MKKGTIAAVMVGAVLLAATTARALTYTADNRLKLIVQSNGQAAIVNTTTGMLGMDGYRICSTAGLLNPSRKVTLVDPDIGEWEETLCQPEVCWSSFEDRCYVGGDYYRALTGPAPTYSGVGPYLGYFAEYENSSACLSETAMDMYVYVRKAGTAAPIPLGRITNSPTLGDLQFQYTMPWQYGGTIGVIYLGQVEIVAEPATLALLAAGALAMKRRRRQA